MKPLNAYLLIFMAAVTFGCSPSEEGIINNVHWKKIEIDDHGPVYAIYGSIDNVMLVSVYGRIWRSANGGETWHKVFTTVETIGGFKQDTDTLFALSNFTDYYSLTNGETWEEYDKDIALEHQNLFEDINGVQYRIVEHSAGEQALPSEIEKSMDGGNRWRSVYPYKHSIYYVTLDAQNRLYVGIGTQFEWNEEEGWFTENLEAKTAFYYSVSDLGEAYK
jgi:hypothetical protein